jgi:hypothetical protein
MVLAGTRQNIDEQEMFFLRALPVERDAWKKKK